MKLRRETVLGNRTPWKLAALTFVAIFGAEVSIISCAALLLQRFSH